MLEMSLREIAEVCTGKVSSSFAERTVRGVVTDTRALQPHALFVALKGERFDGNAYVPQALAAGVGACLTERANVDEQACVLVDDALRAFQQLSKTWRAKFADLPILALTGSNGKTTVKEMLRTILVAHCEGDESAVLATQGNLNNHIGVPIMLARLGAGHRFAVVEAGMNHFGEIKTLTHLIRPTVALINNAGPAHLEGVGTIDGVARAKGEIFEGLRDDGVAILNADDPFYYYWRALIKPTQRILSFGTKEDAHVRGEWRSVAANEPMRVHYKTRSATCALEAMGGHNRMNALAAISGAIALGVPMEHAVESLNGFASTAGRQRIMQGHHGATIIDDSYNANPASMKAAVDSLVTLPGTRLLVLGQMAELGEYSEALHAELGRYIAHCPIERLFATGERMRKTVDACNQTRAQSAVWFSDKSTLIVALNEALTPQASVLVKGSRSSAMEEVLAAISEKETAIGGNH